jgi:hypothetical protein
VGFKGFSEFFFGVSEFFFDDFAFGDVADNGLQIDLSIEFDPVQAYLRIEFRFIKPAVFLFKGLRLTGQRQVYLFQRFLH